MRATVKDVARLAGVSPKTVSNVINATVPVAPATRARVEQALAELDYVPNLAARGLRNGRTGVVALALPDLAAPYSAAVVQAFVRVAKQRGTTIQVEETGTRADREAALINRAREQLVDGLVLNPVHIDLSTIQQADSLPPLVLIGEVELPSVDHVGIDQAALRTLVEGLLRAGRRRVAVLGVMASATSQLRLAAYRDTLRAAGIEPDPADEIPSAHWNSRGGHDAVLAHLASGAQPPDAVVCFNDSLALGAMGALARAGLDIPSQVAVSGFDDLEVGRWTHPSLSTVTFDHEQLAATTLDLLAARIADGSRAPQRRTIASTLVLRDSTGPLPLDDLPTG
ncbi:LacI family DNA-binding transcriptional regulator [Desertihabitans aurantiacus]|uniref:LacI family DNA-binding transcriptional regulator n=1 Tax=Desertihabitans aurantiacus TaxID=2282477 RepID=UPI000DF79C28|nr:LacI family DNA-binding transcriptional regulator [Desertihabitans aurantiacus]